MLDNEILDLFWQRDEQAIAAAQSEYGRYCYGIALRLLDNREDAEECVNDTWHDAWCQIPPERPRKLRNWLGRIVRCRAINLWNRNHAQKRYNGMEELLSELDDCIPDPRNIESQVEDAEMGQVISQWLRSLSKEDRVLFVQRYWEGKSLQDLAEARGVPASRLGQRMYRLRNQLREVLKKEGMFV